MKQDTDRGEREREIKKVEKIKSVFTKIKLFSIF